METNQPMEQYAIPSTGGTATISILGDKDLMDVLTLQEVTRASLPEQMKMFVLAQAPSYFEALLARRTGIIVGIRAEGKLIGQLAVVGPMELREVIAGRLITKNDVYFHHAALTDSVVVLKSMSVHPEWRGNDHSKHLVAFAMDAQITKSASHVFTQISAGNRRSWDVFLRAGFGVVAAGHDPKDGKPRFILQKPLFGFAYDGEVMADEVDPKEDFAAIIALTERNALIGNYEHGANGKLSFMRNADEEISIKTMQTLARVRAG